MENLKLHDLGTFWLGKDISFVELLCFETMRKMGHKLTMYCYSRPSNLPDWVESRDPSEIYDPEFIISQNKKRTPAPHADMFRLKMIQKTNKVWVDGDLLLRKPIEYTNDFVVGYETKDRIGNSVLRFPSDSAILQKYIDDLQKLIDELPYTEETDDAFKRFGVQKISRFYDMPISAMGPNVLTARRNDPELENNIRPTNVFFPVYISDVRVFVRRPSIVSGVAGDETIGIHLWSSRLKNAMAKRPQAQIEASFIGWVCRENKISMDSFFEAIVQNEKGAD